MAAFATGSPPTAKDTINKTVIASRFLTGQLYALAKILLGVVLIPSPSKLTTPGPP
jgi:hypothetical protein